MLCHESLVFWRDWLWYKSSEVCQFGKLHFSFGMGAEQYGLQSQALQKTIVLHLRVTAAIYAVFDHSTKVRRWKYWSEARRNLWVMWRYRRHRNHPVYSMNESVRELRMQHHGSKMTIKWGTDIAKLVSSKEYRNFLWNSDNTVWHVQ